MLERELTPRNVDSSRGQAGWKSCSVFRWDQGKTKQSLLPTLRSYQQCIIHFTGAVNRLICIIFRRNLHLVCFRPRKENPQIFNGSNEIHCWDPVFLHQISRYLKMCLSSYLPASESAMVKAKNHLFANVKKWFRIQMLFIPSSKNPGRLRWRVDRRLWNRSLACLLFYFSWQLSLWCISPVQINCLLARAPWDWKLFTPHKNENN